MSTDSTENNTSEFDFSEHPDPSINEDFLDNRLDTLSQRYSYERLSDLSAVRLGAVEGSDDGLSEWDFLHKDFERLYKRFPAQDSDRWLRLVTLDEEHRDFAPLTMEQKQRIEDCHRKCSRNLDRARQDALDREDSPSPLSRFANWTVEFAEAVTPIVHIQR